MTALSPCLAVTYPSGCRYCSGPTVTGPLMRPDETLSANVSVFPQWLVDTGSGLQDALVQIAGFSLNLKPGVSQALSGAPSSPGARQHGCVLCEGAGQEMIGRRGAKLGCWYSRV
jgi:hypothetical protein